MLKEVFHGEGKTCKSESHFYINNIVWEGIKGVREKNSEAKIKSFVFLILIYSVNIAYEEVKWITMK